MQAIKLPFKDTLFSDDSLEEGNVDDENDDIYSIEELENAVFSEPEEGFRFFEPRFQQRIFTKIIQILMQKISRYLSQMILTMTKLLEKSLKKKNKLQGLKKE